MGLDESRQYLNGIYLHIVKKQFRQLQQMDIDWQNVQLIKINIKSFEGIIIPKKTVSEISKIAEDFDDKSFIKFFKNQN